MSLEKLPSSKKSVFYDGVKRWAVRQIFLVEPEEHWFLTNERILLTNRAPGKYDVITLAINAISSINPLSLFPGQKREKGLFPALEPAYYTGRIPDDIADGHRPLPEGFENFKEWIDHLKQLLDSDFQSVPTDTTFEYLFKKAYERLLPLQKSSDDVKDLYNKFFDAMVVENLRRSKREVKTEEELQDLNWESFSHVQNIAFIAIKSSARVTKESNLSALPELLRRGYSIRDLKEDLKDNICNIPKIVIEESKLTFEQLSETPELVETNERLQLWISGEVKKCQQLIQVLDNEKLDLSGKLLVKALTTGIKKYIGTLA
jgi:hypothetical protein